MTAVIETLAAPTTHKGQWLAQLVRYRSLLDELGRRPRRRSSDPDESSAAMWFMGQSARHRRGTLKPERASALDQHLPGWKVPWVENKLRAAARVQELKSYRDAYGKWPSSRSRDPLVKSLAIWYYIQRDGAGAASTRELLDAQVPGWDETVQETWERTAQEIAAFRARYGELPSRSSSEHRVSAWGRWIDDMRRGRGMTPARTAHLDEVLPGWRNGLKHWQRPAHLGVQL